MNDPREREITQIIIPGTISMVPPIQSMLELALWRPGKAERAKRYRIGYRNKTTGDGICSKCLQFRKSEEFATPKGYVCKSCVKPGMRGATKNKRQGC